MRAGVFFVVLALLLSGCTRRSNMDGHTLPPQAAGSVEELTVRAPGGVRARAAGDAADLTGPHYTVDVDWVATGPMIRDELTPAVPELTRRRAADGQELFVVAVSAEQTNGFFPLGTAPRPTAELSVDGRTTPLPSLPLPPQDGPVPVPAEGVLLVASVPKGAPVTLSVTDEGRTRTTDLRAGERVSGDGDFGPGARDLLDFDTTVPVAFTGGAATLRIAASAMAEFDPKQALLAPWTPGQGWAAEGRAWLVVPQPVVSTPLMTDMSGLVLVVDDPAVFTVVADGTPHPEIGGTRALTTLAAEYTPTTDPLVFDVPAGLAAATFTMDFAAMGVTAQFYGGDRTVTWTPPPAPFTVPLTFS
jgi:hypothetical protein